MTYDPQPIAYDGGSATITNLPGRGVAYFQVEIPSNAPSWRVQLENTLGENQLYIRKGYLPAFGEGAGSIYSPVSILVKLNKSGDEYYTLLPASNSDSIPAGLYNLMVVGEGQGPSYPYLGTGESAAVLHSLGTAPVVDLGNLPVAGELVHSNGYLAGESDLMQFHVPEGVLALEVRLENPGWETRGCTFGRTSGSRAAGSMASIRGITEVIATRC